MALWVSETAVPAGAQGIKPPESNSISLSHYLMFVAPVTIADTFTVVVTAMEKRDYRRIIKPAAAADQCGKQVIDSATALTKIIL